MIDSAARVTPSTSTTDAPTWCHASTTTAAPASSMTQKSITTPVDRVAVADATGAPWRLGDAVELVEATVFLDPHPQVLGVVAPGPASARSAGAPCSSAAWRDPARGPAGTRPGRHWGHRTRSRYPAPRDHSVGTRRTRRTSRRPTRWGSSRPPARLQGQVRLEGETTGVAPDEDAVRARARVSPEGRRPVAAPPRHAGPRSGRTSRSARPRSSSPGRSRRPGA